MLQLTVAGNVGRDAAYKETQSGKGFCSFTVAANIGFGDSRQTVWVDVTRWGEGAKGLANILRKGSRVAVTGEMSLREHEGKTYVQCRADKVTILGTPDGQREDRPTGGGSFPHPSEVDDDGDIPFITRDTMF